MNIAYDDDFPEAGMDIYMLPPENACGEITDEDSGDENNLAIDNLPPSQLRAPVEIKFNNTGNFSSSSDSDDEEYTMPLSELAKRLSKKTNQILKRKKTDFKWVKKDFEIGDSDDEWPCDISEVIAKKHPLELFQNFFDNDLINLIANESNRYINKYFLAHVLIYFPVFFLDMQTRKTNKEIFLLGKLDHFWECYY